MSVRISVVIPHLNQPEALRVGLEALHAQVGAARPVEIIVVDNGSVRPPIEICAEWPDVRLVSESEPGPGPARNAGVRELSAPEVVAFIDADCRADTRWLATIERRFSDPDVQIIGGAVLVAYRDPNHPSPLEPYEAIYSYRNHEHVAEGFSGTGNLAVRFEVLDTVGPFAGISVAEDREWGFRARDRGFKIDYVDEMVVYHPARESFAELEQKWDRHVAHDFQHYASGRWGRSKWVVRAIAVALSPLAEIPTVVRSNRVSGARQRCLALYGLIRIRLYRGWAMVKLLADAEARHSSQVWNRASLDAAREESGADR
jgi:glycosyltransferase involved in cell wall biosynthesis